MDQRAKSVELNVIVVVKFVLHFSTANHASNPVDLIHFFNSALLSGKEKSGFDFVSARPLRSCVEVKSSITFLSFYLCPSFCLITLVPSAIVSFMLSFQKNSQI